MTKHHRYVQGAIDYAEADKSDPFARARALSHVYNGLARPRQLPNGDREECYYSARKNTEVRRLPAGTTFSDGSDTYESQVWRDVKVI